MMISSTPGKKSWKEKLKVELTVDMKIAHETVAIEGYDKKEDRLYHSGPTVS